LAQNYTKEVSIFLKRHNTKETIKGLSEEVTKYYNKIEYDSKFYLDKATIKIFYLDAEIQFEEIYSKDKNSNLNFYEAALENYNKILKIIENYKDYDYLNIYNKNDRIIDESEYLSILFLKRVTIYMKI
jgi:transcription-repair coupling factor (superfamily II helicase)